MKDRTEALNENNSLLAHLNLFHSLRCWDTKTTKKTHAFTITAELSMRYNTCRIVMFNYIIYKSKQSTFIVCLAVVRERLQRELTYNLCWLFMRRYRI